MNDRLVQNVFTLVCLVLFAAVQDLFPSFGGVKPPLLLGFALCSTLTAPRTEHAVGEHRGASFPAWPFTAFFAGAFLDTLTGFPHGCSTGFALFACSVARFTRAALRTLPETARGAATLAAAAPAYELWLGAWGVTGPEPSLIIRFFSAALFAVPCGALLFTLIPAAARWAGLDPDGTEDLS